MAGTISMAGLASGMDVSGIIDALVTAASTPKSQLQNRLSLTNSASTNVSDIASYLSKLKTAVDALATPEKAQSYSATSSNTAISASITTSTSAARYSINVIPRKSTAPTLPSRTRRVHVSKSLGNYLSKLEAAPPN